MKIAVAISTNNKISGHFGRSPFFNIYHVDNMEILDVEKRANTFTPHFKSGNTHAGQDHPHNHGDPSRHNHGHNDVLKGLHDVDVVICGGMGQGAYNSLVQDGKKVIVTHLLSAEEATQKHIEGKLQNDLKRVH